MTGEGHHDGRRHQSTDEGPLFKSSGMVASTFRSNTPLSPVQLRKKRPITMGNDWPPLEDYPIRNISTPPLLTGPKLMMAFLPFVLRGPGCALLLAQRALLFAQRLLLLAQCLCGALAESYGHLNRKSCRILKGGLERRLYTSLC